MPCSGRENNILLGSPRRKFLPLIVELSGGGRTPLIWLGSPTESARWFRALSVTGRISQSYPLTIRSIVEEFVGEGVGELRHRFIESTNWIILLPRECRPTVAIFGKDELFPFLEELALRRRF